MRGATKGGPVDAVRTLIECGTATGAGDVDLLGRFAGLRDESAFAALVERHGPMVLRACRSALRDDHDALDAFQATFLVLARRVGSLRSAESLGPWLHRVALRASARARRADWRRRAAERRAVESAGPATDGPVLGPDRDETTAAVQQEVDRLPDRFRAAVVLCDLEGLTCAEAASRLGSPVGTVASRLARGRDRLRDGLRRRGFDPRTASSAPIAWPHGLAESTAAAAVRFLSSPAAPRGPAASLALGVLEAMTHKAWWKAAAVATALVASTSGILALAAREGGAPAQEPTPSPSVSSPGGSSKPVVPAKAEPSPATIDALPGRVEMTVSGEGVLKPLRSESLRVPQGVPNPKVAFLIRPGAVVAKGDEVARLTPGATPEPSDEQKAALQSNRVEVGRLAQEMKDAESALAEYEDGGFSIERNAANARIKVAEQALAAAKARVERAKRAREQSAAILQGVKGAATPTEILADSTLQDRLAEAELALTPASFALEDAQSKLDVLSRFTHPRTLARLKAEVERLRSLLEANQVLTGMLPAAESGAGPLSIRSPVDGVVVPAEMIGASPVKAGDGVAPGQILASIKNADGRMKATALIDEDLIDLIEPGRPVWVQLPTLNGGVTLAGEVDAVSPFPGETTHSNYGPRRKYAVTARLLDQPSGLSLPPGMFARVQIPIQGRPDAPILPASVLVWYDGKQHVAVPHAGGEVEWREIVGGLTQDKSKIRWDGPLANAKETPDEIMVEIREGLKPGEAVVLDPWSLLSDEQRRKASSVSARTGSDERTPARRAAIVSKILDKLAPFFEIHGDSIRNAAPPARAEHLRRFGLSEEEIKLYEEIPAEDGGPF